MRRDRTMPELSADLYGTVSHKLDALQPSGIREFNKEVSKIPAFPFVEHSENHLPQYF